MKSSELRGASQHVVVNMEGGWSVKAGGSSRSSKRFKTEEEAVRYAREVARRTSGVVYFHRADGSVRDKVSF